MKRATRYFFAPLVLSLLMWASLPHAYPVYVKIENPRAHSLFIVSENQRTTVEIPSKGWHEFKICAAGDWKVRYNSGLGGLLTSWNLDEELNYFIETSCKNSIGVNWNTRTVKYCTLKLDEIQNGFGRAIYTLSVAEVRDLDISYESDECKMSANELAKKVNPQSPGCPLVSQNALAAAACLFTGIKPAGTK